MSQSVLGHRHLDDLLGVLAQIPGLADANVRNMHVDALRRALRRPVNIPRFPDRHGDLNSIITSCLAYTGALLTFTRLVHQYHRTEASSRAVAMTEDIIGTAPLSTPDREELRAHLAGISVWQVADALDGIEEATALRSLDTWRDVPAAIRAMESLPPSADGRHPLLTFTAHLARLVPGPVGEELRHWVVRVSGGFGGEAVESFAVQAPPVAAPDQDGPWARKPAVEPRGPDDPRTIWGGGVPVRNRYFTGRAALLDKLGDALRQRSKASVLPQTLHGMGGIGKTQLVIEYVHRFRDQYDLVWWVPAEQTATVLSSLTQLAERLDLGVTEDRQQTARIVLDHLASTNLTWLLVYDNAGDPDSLDQLMPSAGGHVILTTRIHEWGTVGPAIEVDVFERQESIELLRKRSEDEKGTPRIVESEADELAEKLGDLPLALEQAVAWHLATAMPVKEYIALLDSHIEELLSEGKPAGYPVSVAAFVSLAVKRLYRTAPATAQVFELFAYFGGEPVPVSLLRYGKDADVTPSLRAMLSDSVATNRATRDLNRYGLAKLDPAQRLQVHRLVQRVLRETMPPDRAAETLRNARNLLAQANPGDPDELVDYSRHADIGPHIDPAAMIHAETVEARRVVLNHARYLYIIGDYENSRRLARQAATAWDQKADDPRVGPDGDLTLTALAQVANATRTLGDSRTAARLTRDVYDRFKEKADIGPEHETTLTTRNQVGADLRIAGRYAEALEFEQESVALHRSVFGPGDTYTLRAESNLAVDYRMIGQFAQALTTDKEVADRWRDVGVNDRRLLETYMNVARDYYGLGAYRAALETLDQWRPALQEVYGPGHRLVLLAGRTYGTVLRKVGRTADAVEAIRDNLESTRSRFVASHEFSVAATMSYSNALREVGEYDLAMEQMLDAVDRYQEHFGERHPATLVAQVNEAIIRRAQGELDRARELDERCLRELTEVLSPDHPYTLCAGSSLANDLALAGEHEHALRTSRKIYGQSRSISGGGHEARGGAEHPYLLLRGVNLSFDLRATGDIEQADAMLEESLSGLRRSLGAHHPEVVGAEQGRRTEGDIEPPPT